MNDKKLTIPPRKFRGDTAVVSARIPKDLIAELDRLSENTGRNRNEIIEMCLEFAVEHIDEE